jgi:hypothetical protein
VKLVGQLSIAATAVSVSDDPDAPRIWIRFGRFRISLTEAEAVRIAAQIIDALAESPRHRTNAK